MNGSERCVWWDFAAADGQGKWSTDGCSTTLTDNMDPDVVKCLCTHLTNFAILVVSPQNIPSFLQVESFPPQDICARLEDCAVEENPVLTKTLSFVTYIGTSLSMLGLFLSVLTLLAFP